MEEDSEEEISQEETKPVRNYGSVVNGEVECSQTLILTRYIFL